MNPVLLALGTRPVGDGQPCFVLAEVASAHGGSVDRALRMLEAAFKMGADGIKFQLFKADLLVVHRHPLRKDFDQIELTREGVAQGAARGARARAWRCWWRPSTAPSLELAVEEGADAYKVHTTDMENPEFIRAVAEARQARALRHRRRARGGGARRRWTSCGDGPVALLHGFQTFPTPVEEIRFRELAAWKERYRVPVGFLDHTDGGSAFALVAPALAVAYGANLVEKHFTLDRSEKGFDYQSSLSPEDFYRMVELLRQAERAAGDGSRRRQRGRAQLPPAHGPLHRGRLAHPARARC